MHRRQGLRSDRAGYSFPNKGKHVDILVDAEELVVMAQVELVHKGVQGVQEEVDGYI
jgi:hypothetical protein